MSSTPQWQALKFASQIFAIYRLPGGTWRYLRDKGSRRTFATEREAEVAARDRALSILFPQPKKAEPTEAKVAAALGRDEWLQQKRADQKAARKLVRKGGKVTIVMHGRARA